MKCPECDNEQNFEITGTSKPIVVDAALAGTPKAYLEVSTSVDLKCCVCGRCFTQVVDQEFVVQKKVEPIPLVIQENDELWDRFVREFSMSVMAELVAFEFTRFDLFCLIAQVQLAGRHPQNTGDSRERVENLIRAMVVGANFPPACMDVIERGWNQAFDE